MGGVNDYDLHASAMSFRTLCKLKSHRLAKQRLFLSVPHIFTALGKQLQAAVGEHLLLALVSGGIIKDQPHLVECSRQSLHAQLSVWIISGAGSLHQSWRSPGAVINILILAGGGDWCKMEALGPG